MFARRKDNLSSINYGCLIFIVRCYLLLSSTCYVQQNVNTKNGRQFLNAEIETKTQKCDPL